MEPVLFLVVEDAVKAARFVLFIESHTGFAVKNVQSLARMEHDQFGVLVEGATIKVFMLSSLCTLERAGTIFLEKWDLLGASEVAAF